MNHEEIWRRSVSCVRIDTFNVYRFDRDLFVEERRKSSRSKRNSDTKTVLST